MKTAELTGPLLDYWVAKALDLNVQMRYRAEVRGEIAVLVEGDSTRGIPHYSSDWALGGPIIEREHIDVSHRYFTVSPDKTICLSTAAVSKCYNGLTFQEEPMPGTTILEAAMRCFVASKFGDEATT